MEANNESPGSGASPEEKTPRCTGKSADGERGKHCCRRHGRIGLALVVGAIIGVLAFNAHSGQSGTGSMCSSWHGHRGPHNHFGATDASQGAEFVIDRMMSDVKADDAQKLKARRIADAAASDVQELATQHHERHKELVAILSAPTLDRARLEALRTKSVHSIDESSKRIVVAVADLAEVLTPAQRLQLVERIERKHGFEASE